MKHNSAFMGIIPTNCFKHHFQKNKDWNQNFSKSLTYLFVNFKHHFQKNKDWNSFFIKHDLFSHCTLNTTSRKIRIETKIRNINASRKAGFKHHFQKNKDWNSVFAFLSRFFYHFKHHFQKNKDWNKLEQVLIASSEKL